MPLEVKFLPTMSANGLNLNLHASPVFSSYYMVSVCPHINSDMKWQLFMSFHAIES